MDNIAGPPVEGENFFGREAAVAKLRSDLEHHDVLLLGARRIGKTSAARAVIKVVLEESWKAVEINVASCIDEQQFVEKMALALHEQAKSNASQTISSIGNRISDLLSRVQKIEIAGVAGVDLSGTKEEDWTALATATLKLMTEIQGKWLIYLDELPIMLFAIIANDATTGVARVRRFLDWFRNDVRAMPECKSVRWLVTGSVGLDTLVQRHGMEDTINSLKHSTLAPYDLAQAQQMLEKLALSYDVKFGEGDVKYFVESISWPQPYYLQRSFNYFREKQLTGSIEVRADIDEAIAKLSHPDQDNDFQWWRKRLVMQLGKIDGGHADALLALASQVRAGVEGTQLLELLRKRMPEFYEDEQRNKFIELRDILIRDAYWRIVEIDAKQGYCFNLEPLRQWWERRTRV